MVLGDVNRKVGVVLLHRASVLSCHAAADRSSGGQLRAPLHVPIPESASEENANVRPHLEPKNRGAEVPDRGPRALAAVGPPPGQLGRKERLSWGRRSSTCGSAAVALIDEMSGSTMAARISAPTAAAEDRRRTAAPCG